MSWTMTIEFPALDRLCAWLEGVTKSGMAAQIETEIVRQLKEAAEGGATRPKAGKLPKPEPSGDASRAGSVEETSSVTTDAVPPSPKGKAQEAAAPDVKEPEAAAATPASPPATSPVTLDALQRAAAQMRDEGKLKAVTDLFPEFGIRKLSDLKGDALEQFGARLRKMGARL